MCMSHVVYKDEKRIKCVNIHKMFRIGHGATQILVVDGFIIKLLTHPLAILSCL